MEFITSVSPNFFEIINYGLSQKFKFFKNGEFNYNSYGSKLPFNKWGSLIMGGRVQAGSKLGPFALIS